MHLQNALTCEGNFCAFCCIVDLPSFHIPVNDNGKAINRTFLMFIFAQSPKHTENILRKQNTTLSSTNP